MNRFLFISIKLVKRTNKLVLSLFYFFTIAVNSQDFKKQIEGRVYSEDGDVAAVHVSNISINRGTITDVSGYFQISGSLNDTLVFSAVQFQRVKIVITLEVLQNDILNVLLKEFLTELDEVVVMPYNLSGELKRDMGKLSLDAILTASTEGLPNAYVKPPTQSQRKLYTARTWDIKGTSVKLDPLINYFSGRTKRLKKRVGREARSKWIEEVRGYYPDSLYVQELKIPKKNLIDFIYSCEKDSLFEATAKNGNRLQLWEVLKKKSIKYLEDNDLVKK